MDEAADGANAFCFYQSRMSSQSSARSVFQCIINIRCVTLLNMRGDDVFRYCQPAL